MKTKKSKVQLLNQALPGLVAQIEETSKRNLDEIMVDAIRQLNEGTTMETVAELLGVSVDDFDKRLNGYLSGHPDIVVKIKLRGD